MIRVCSILQRKERNGELQFGKPSKFSRETAVRGQEKGPPIAVGGSRADICKTAGHLKTSSTRRCCAFALAAARRRRRCLRSSGPASPVEPPPPPPSPALPPLRPSWKSSPPSAEVTPFFPRTVEQFSRSSFIPCCSLELAPPICPLHHIVWRAAESGIRLPILKAGVPGRRAWRPR